MAARLAGELMDAARNEGNAVEKRATTRTRWPRRDPAFARFPLLKFFGCFPHRATFASDGAAPLLIIDRSLVRICPLSGRGP